SSSRETSQRTSAVPSGFPCDCRSATTTSAPSRTKRRVSPAPMPLQPPVTTTTRSRSSMRILFRKCESERLILAQRCTFRSETRAILWWQLRKDRIEPRRYDVRHHVVVFAGALLARAIEGRDARRGLHAPAHRVDERERQKQSVVVALVREPRKCVA